MSASGNFWSTNSAKGEWDDYGAGYVFCKAFTQLLICQDVRTSESLESQTFHSPKLQTSVTLPRYGRYCGRTQGRRGQVHNSRPCCGLPAEKSSDCACRFRSESKRLRLGC